MDPDDLTPPLRRRITLVAAAAVAAAVTAGVDAAASRLVRTTAPAGAEASAQQFLADLAEGRPGDAHQALCAETARTHSVGSLAAHTGTPLTAIHLARTPTGRGIAYSGHSSDRHLGAELRLELRDGAWAVCDFTVTTSTSPH